MKITHNKVGQNLNLTDSTRTGKSDKTKKAGETKDSLLSALDTKSSKETEESTKVQLSQRAQDIKKSKEIALAAPDVREDKVQRLQKLIDEGNYKVDSSEIANKMVDEELQWT